MDVSIEIKNIGKIEQANIALNGLTITSGENNTGLLNCFVSKNKSNQETYE